MRDSNPRTAAFARPHGLANRPDQPDSSNAPRWQGHSDSNRNRRLWRPLSYAVERYPYDDDEVVGSAGLEPARPFRATGSSTRPVCQNSSTIPQTSGGPPRIATGTLFRGLRPERSVSCMFHQRAKKWRSRRDLNPRRPGVAGPHALSGRAPSAGLGHGSSKVVGAAGIEPTTCTRHPSLQPGVDYQHHSNAPREWCDRRASNPQSP